MPMLPLRLFRSRNFSAANIETFAVYGGLSAWGFFLTLFLQQIAGYSPFMAGLATVPLTIGLFVLSRYVGRLSMRFGPRLFMTAGPLLGAGLRPGARAAPAGSELLGRPVPTARRLRGRPRR